MNGIIFDTEIEAKAFDFGHNTLKGSISKYRYNCKPLTTTTTLTKAEYAELLGIPATYEDEQGNIVDNPQYTELTVPDLLRKHALIVGDDFNVTDEDGNVTGYACPRCGFEVNVVDVSSLIYQPEGI